MIRMKTRKLPTGLAFGLSLIALAAGLFIYRAMAGGAEETVIATVNGEPVIAAEFNRQLGLLRASVIDEFKRAYGAEFGKDFWSTEYKGETPADALKRQALDQAVAMKLQLQLAQAYGIVQGASYHDLLAELERENSRRSRAAAAGQPIYGPVQFDESAFVDFYLSKVLIQLKERLAEELLVLTGDELRSHYERIKEEIFRLEDNVIFSNISISYREQDGHFEDSGRKEQAEAVAGALKRLLEQGLAVEEAVERLREASGELHIHIAEERFNSDTARNYYRSFPQLYAVLAEPMEAGEVSPVMDDPVSGKYMLAVIAGRVAGGYKSFEEQMGNVRKHYVDIWFEDYLDKQLEAAQIHIADGYYSVSVR